MPISAESAQGNKKASEAQQNSHEMQKAYGTIYSSWMVVLISIRNNVAAIFSMATICKFLQQKQKKRIFTSYRSTSLYTKLFWNSIIIQY